MDRGGEIWQEAMHIFHSLLDVAHYLRFLFLEACPFPLDLPFERDALLTREELVAVLPLPGAPP